ncbi:MAG TPA: TIGR00282 family metallophosphoesterase [Armatimonadetes bacterium]|nr:TIGR00282 family metallophosphoesterase [Armatimonadota bacterium]
MRILLVGDVVGRPGRVACRHVLPQLYETESIDFTIINAENGAAGLGVSESVVNELIEAGAHCLTTGNHVWTQKGVAQLLENEPRLLRPANYPPECPGRGSAVFDAVGQRVGVINLEGRVFMNTLDCPFRRADEEIRRLREQGAGPIIVDFHAEATSEKIAMGKYLDGRVTAVIGTHTHVMTADEQILEKGTAYLTDVGMTGPIDGTIIGVRQEEVLSRFLTLMPQRFEVPKSGKSRFGAVLIDYSLDTQRAEQIQRIERILTGDDGSAQ